MADPTPPGPIPYEPLLRPAGRCFHCGASLAANGPCPTCGQDALLTRAQEAGRIAYLLRALDLAVAGGQLPRDLAPRLTAPFRDVLEPGSGRLPTRPAPTPRPAPAPRKPVNFAVLWANALLYLGAFFIVMAAIVFLFAMGGLGRTVLSAMLAVLFLGTGLLCRRIEIVRSAGNIFTATGALVVPLVFVALANYVSGRGPLGAEQIWLLASVACAILYIAFAAFGLGRFYAVLALLATSSAWQALFDVAGLGSQWLPAWFAAQALFLCGIHHAAKALVSRPFGPLVLVWGLLWALPSLVGVAVVSVDDAHPGASVFALLLLIALSALTAWRLGDVVSPLGLGVLVLALVPATLRLLAAPTWAYGVAIIPVTWAYIGYWWWRRTAVARGFLVLGGLAAFSVSFLPIYETAHPAGLLVGLGATAVLALAAVLARAPLLLFAPGATLAALWWHLLQSLPFKGTGAADLGLGYLPLVVLMSVLALALPLTWPAGWRASLGVLAGLYALAVVSLTLPSNRALALTLGLLTLLGAVMVGRWRSPWLLAVPGLTSMALVLTSLRLLDVRPEAAGPSVLLLALAASATGTALRVRAPSSGDGFTLAFRLLGLALAAGAFVVAVLAEVSGGAHWAAHLSGLCLFALAGLIAVEGAWLRTLFYPASAVLLAAVLWEINAFGFRDLQCFAVPLGLYLMLLAIVSARDPMLERSQGPLSALAWVASALAFGLATFVQSLGSHPIRYAVILLLESLFLLGLGLVVRRRGLLATSTTLLVLGGLRLLFLTPELILPALILAGLLLLVVGFVVLVVVGLKQRAAKGGEPAE